MTTWRSAKEYDQGTLENTSINPFSCASIPSWARRRKTRYTNPILWDFLHLDIEGDTNDIQPSSHEQASVARTYPFRFTASFSALHDILPASIYAVETVWLQRHYERLPTSMIFRSRRERPSSLSSSSSDVGNTPDDESAGASEITISTPQDRSCKTTGDSWEIDGAEWFVDRHQHQKAPVCHPLYGLKYALVVFLLMLPWFHQSKIQVLAAPGQCLCLVPPQSTKQIGKKKI